MKPASRRRLAPYRLRTWRNRALFTLAAVVALSLLQRATEALVVLGAVAP